MIRSVHRLVPQITKTAPQKHQGYSERTRWDGSLRVTWWKFKEKNPIIYSKI